MSDPKIKFRLAKLKDAELLLVWRNDKITRMNSLNSDIVAPSDHLKWLRSSLDNQNRKIWIAEIDESPVGSVRFDLDNGTAEMSWTLAPEFRNKGLGKILLSAGIGLFPGDLTAKIKTRNIASIKIAENVGFRKISEADGVSVWLLNKSES